MKEGGSEGGGAEMKEERGVIILPATLEPISNSTSVLDPTLFNATMLAL